MYEVDLNAYSPESLCSAVFEIKNKFFKKIYLQRFMYRGSSVARLVVTNTSYYYDCLLVKLRERKINEFEILHPLKFCTFSF